jgi:hypothetical protein
MARKKNPHENEVQTIGVIREKEDGIYFVTVIFEPGYGPIFILDEQGNSQLEGGEYEIKKATWNRYNTRGRGTYIEPDEPATDWGEGPVTGCKVVYQNGEPTFMWDREEDFAITGPGVKMHVRKLDRAAYRLREALQELREQHPRITLKSAHTRVARVMREVIPRKPRRPYKPTGNRRGAPIKSDFTIEIRRLKKAGESCRDAQKKMFTWHRQRFPIGHPQSRSRESINRSVRRIYAEKDGR